MNLLLTILFMLTALLSNAQVTFQRMYGKHKQGGIGQVGYGIQQTYDGGFIIAGGRDATTTIDGCVIRTDSDGNTLWASLITP